MPSEQTIRLSLPSKGRLGSGSLDFLSDAGLQVFKPNPRQYQADIPVLPDLGVIFQRPGDIVVSVRQGSVDFGVTGLDVVEEKRGENGDVLVLHDALGLVIARLRWLSPKPGMQCETWLRSKPSLLPWLVRCGLPQNSPC